MSVVVDVVVVVVAAVVVEQSSSAGYGCCSSLAGCGVADLAQVGQSFPGFWFPSCCVRFPFHCFSSCNFLVGL